MINVENSVILRVYINLQPFTPMDYTTILENIKSARKEKNKSQREIAEALGITQTQYSKLESGESAMTIPQLLSVSSALEVEIMNLFGNFLDEGLLEKNKQLLSEHRKIAVGIADIIKKAL